MAAPRPSRLSTSAARVASRHRDPTFEKLMSRLLLLLRATSVVDLVLASPDRSLPLPLLLHPSSSRRLRLPRGAPHFLRSHPHLFSLRLNPKPSSLLLTPAAADAAAAESSAAAVSSSSDLLRRLLSISPSRSSPPRPLPLVAPPRPPRRLRGLRPRRPPLPLLPPPHPASHLPPPLPPLPQPKP
ncbi:hypothetical protein ACMD2_06419 [Ananas comosus]|uniref:PORR domain-containing protein n=1 Tax=Ananas comosus TaxID=4615 RepID=A0A199VDK7_ANACO|nr:hypothetical protein ACMD2_06419 [Ananas comosus]